MYQFCISTPLLNFCIVYFSFSSGSLKSFQFSLVTHLCPTLQPHALQCTRPCFLDLLLFSLILREQELGEDGERMCSLNQEGGDHRGLMLLVALVRV